MQTISSLSNSVSNNLSEESLKLDLDIFGNLDLLALKLKNFGFKVTTTSPNAIQKLATLKIEQKLELNQTYLKMLELLSTVKLETEPDATFGLETEKKLLKRILNHEGSEAPDDFWTKLESNHHMQVFNDQMVQTYRSFNFFDICAYSLLDLSVFEWYVLWERPKLILEAMHKHVEDVFQSSFQSKEVLIPKHIVRETFNSGNSSPFIPRAALTRFHQIAPLRRPGGSRTVGFIVTSSAQLIAEGEEALDINFV
jgi:hypothetical protein